MTNKIDYSNIENVVARVIKNGNALENVSEDLKADKIIVMIAVSDRGEALQYASEALKADREVVMIAVEKRGEALQYASEALRSDPEVVIAAIKEDGGALAYASEKLRSDPEVVIAAIDENIKALQHANKDLRGDPKVMMASVEKEGRALEYASEALRANKEVVMAAVENNGSALQYASEALKADREFVMAVVKEDGRALAYASETLRNDPDIALVAVKQFCYALRYASERTRDKMKIIFIGSELVKDKSFLKDLFAIDVNVARYLEIQKEITYDLLNKVSNINKYQDLDRLLSEQTNFSSEEESHYIMPKIMGSYNQLCEMIYSNAYNNRLDTDILKSKLPSQLTIADEVIQKMLEFLSYADLVNLQFLATNRFVEDKNDQGEVIKRLPKLENEWEDAKGDKFASITKTDRQLGIQTFFRRKDINGPTELCNHARHKQ